MEPLTFWNLDSGTDKEQELEKNWKSSPYAKAKARATGAAARPEFRLVDTRPKAQFTSLSRIFDPIMKSRSRRNASQVGTEHGNTAIHPANFRNNLLFSKSLLKDYSNAPNEGVMTAASSPTHLHGVIKVDTENESPSFAFFINDRDDVLHSRTWRTNNADSWVYTFHCSKKKNNGGTRAKDQHDYSPPVVGQMQVSYLSSEIGQTEALGSASTIAFVLYKIVQARRRFLVEDRYFSYSELPPSHDYMNSLDTNSSSQKIKFMDHSSPARFAISSYYLEKPTSYPWSPGDLHPQLEIATVVIQIPPQGSRNFKDLEKAIAKENQNLAATSPFDFSYDTTQNSALVMVITPSGMHGLPDEDECGPSTLLDRWRFGGGCDCGGWDMGCPILVFDNLHDDDLLDCLRPESQKPILLYHQGTKDKIPALSLRADGEGCYLVDFHAQLSALQAFSICIAILHSSEASAAVLPKKNKKETFSDQLMLVEEEEEEEMCHLIGTAGGGGGGGGGGGQLVERRRVELISPSLLNPPFSPMSRV